VVLAEELVLVEASSVAMACTVAEPRGGSISLSRSSSSSGTKSGMSIVCECDGPGVAGEEKSLCMSCGWSDYR
jgi:hypothetical protein